MLWSLLKVLVFVAIAAALTYGATLLIETPGGVRIAFAGQEVSLSPLGFVLAVLALLAALWIILKVAGFLIAILRFLTGDETAITRYFDRNRERRGFDALTEGLMALAAGEGKTAQAKASKAEKLLNRPELTRLLNAQAAEMNGNRERALAYYKEMIGDDRTRFVGVHGLLKQKLAQGDTETSLRLAEKAFALKPRHHGVLGTLFDLQSDQKDWAGARRTLEAKIKAGALPRDVGKRRDAVLSLSDAHAALADDNMDRARNAAYQANKLAPALIPAATLTARLRSEMGEERTAARVLRKAWDIEPHPDIAASFAALQPDETPDARQKRFSTLLKSHPDHPETRMVSAELALAAEDFPGARRALGDLAEAHPTARAIAIMAAIEKGEGAPDQVVRGWLAKALSAPRGDAWVCENCHHIHAAWLPICENCKGFDTLSWATPPATADQGGLTAAMLPLIVGEIEQAPSEDPAPTAATEPETVIDPDPVTEPVIDHDLPDTPPEPDPAAPIDEDPRPAQASSG